MQQALVVIVLSIGLLLGVGAMAADFAVTSASYTEGGRIPAKYACRSKGGSDTSIELSWSNAPPGTKSFAIIMDDPDARPVAGYTWVHWNVFNVPASVASVPETRDGKVSGAVTTRNHFGKADYGGPCPPSGTHTYITSVYALDTTLENPPSAITRRRFEMEFASNILAKAETRGRF